MSITQFQDSIQDRLRVAVQASLPCQAAPVQLALGALLSAQQVPVHTLIACSLDEGEACLHVGAALDLVHIGLQRLHVSYTAAWRAERGDLRGRREWIARYDAASSRFASCRFVETLGQGGEAPEAIAVREVHDLFCRADRDLALA